MSNRSTANNEPRLLEKSMRGRGKREQQRCGVDDSSVGTGAHGWENQFFAVSRGEDRNDVEATAVDDCC